MARDAVSQYRHWFEYEKDAHRKVLDSLETIPPEGRQSASFQKILDLMGHLVAARRMWLFRMGITPERPAQLFPTGVQLEALKAELEGMERLWDGFFQGLDASQLDGVLEYKSLDAGGFRNRIEDILAQLFGHSSYHRGQIATLVKASGGQPAITDYIYWCREPIPEAK